MDRSTEKNTKTKSIDEEKLMLSFNELLRGVKGSGKDSIGGEATELPSMPGMFIESYGLVPLPLNTSVAEDLIKISCQAPYGHGLETRVDTSVRDTHEIDPSKISFHNPDWAASLRLLVERVGSGLGCHGRIVSSLYKLLLYKQGGHFLKHVDTEKEKNMFGTLVIQLPSVHEGGQMVIHHHIGQSTTQYDFGAETKRGAFVPHFVAHYADVEHEILEVKSGYRLALTYSLCWKDDGNGHSITNNQGLIGPLAEIYKKLNVTQNRIGIMLEHKYSNQSLETNGFKALKGRDNDWFTLLNDANKKLETSERMFFHIASAEYQNSYWADGGWDTDDKNESYDESGGDESSSAGGVKWVENENSSKLTVSAWFDLNGKVNFQKRQIRKTDIESFFTDLVDPNNEAKSLFDPRDKASWGMRHVSIKGYQGNWPGDKTTTYHKHFLTLWPSMSQFELNLKTNIDICIDMLHETLKSDHKDPSFLKRLSLVLDKSAMESVQNWEKLTAILIKMNDLNMCKTMLKSTHKLPPTQMLELIQFFGWTQLKDELHLMPITIENAANNCILVNALSEHGLAGASSECFQFAVLPILTAHPSPSKLTTTACFELAKAALAFNDGAYMQTFRNLMKSLEADQLKELLDLIRKNKALCSHSAIQDLFKLRISWLNSKINEGVSSSLKIAIPSRVVEDFSKYPQIQGFLKNDKEGCFVHDGLKDLKHANNFARKHSHACLVLTPYMVGNRPRCRLEKVHSLKLKEVEELREEYSCIKKFLEANKVVSTVESAEQLMDNPEKVKAKRGRPSKKDIAERTESESNSEEKGNEASRNGSKRLKKI